MLFIVAVIAGRVVPMFTNNGVPARTPAALPWVERAAREPPLVAGRDLDGPASLTVAARAVAAAAHLARWPLEPVEERSAAPLVWSLHAAYAWILVHLALRRPRAQGLEPAARATHALTIGTIGGMTSP